MPTAILLAGLIAGLTAAPRREPAAPPPPPQRIIDMHVHAMETDPRWDALIGNPVTGRKMTATNEAAHRDATFAP